MGTDDTKRRRSYAAPPAAVLCGIFVLGIGSGVILTFIAAQVVSRRSEILEVKPQKLRSGMLNAPGTSLSPADKKNEFWIETISDLPGPRIYVLHNILTKEECESLKSLGVMAGMEKALIIPYGGKELVESSTRTNTAAWLEYHQGPVVTKLENLLAKVTNTEPENGENLQILHYQTSQQFKEHHDYFDPATDPPENFEPGGNRLATAIIYLQNAEEGGETDFMKIDTKVKPEAGSAVLFYDLKPDGSVDKLTIHSGNPPKGGEKWVATKWIHERRYQGLPRHVKKAEPAKKEEEVVDNGKSSAPVDADTAQGAKQ
ncbi:hypothetical protein GUITHDRAFT_150687 [Guillardia theta CCMP2712]|uniref:Fe2OG dioxygenase domain-containing protein n=1 Tax=Guillardia theta (strain CCMP2712) TaxID=905079 RepID=L1JUL6_GUITC|nr:hypothetical protein GUITHDRAFT_150687 [Guillardia theta CCMP2712]EKX52107.1 hypothetical protein GUITHDRAFT_150687 [Guillardia theta CCMP2712]|eukprot:XP_005839087.1 hypothetical protein GUITHDRAFT_150687 [Guillardia theta CCMP2712]